MEVIRHDHVRADVCTVLFSMASECEEGLVDVAPREERLSIEGASGNEVNWERREDPVEASETLRA